MNRPPRSTPRPSIRSFRTSLNADAPASLFLLQLIARSSPTPPTASSSFGTEGSSMNEETAWQPLVSAQGLARSFVQGGRAIEALKPTTLTIRPKAHTAVMGSSGSGKSTLLHLIAAIDTPTGGKIAWPALGRREDLRPGKIAIAFQMPSLVPFLTVA